MREGDGEPGISRGSLGRSPLGPAGTSAFGRLSASEAAAGSVRAGISQHADHCPYGIVITSGQDDEQSVVEYANPSFRLLAGAEDRKVVGIGFFDAFSELDTAVVRTALINLRDAGCAQTVEVHGRSGLTTTAETESLMLTISIVRVPHSSDSDDSYKSLLWQLGPASVNTAREAARDERWTAAQAAMSAELLAVNQRLVVAALHEQELKDRAETASKAKSDFLTTMSHELRTPLNAIIGYASLLDGEVWGPLDPKQHEHLNRLKLSARHLLRLIDDVLTLARVEADKETLTLEDIDAGSLLNDALTMTIPLAVAKQLSCSIVQVSPFTIQSDRGKLLQILVNLLGNAIKFTDHGEIKLTAAVDEASAKFAVWDTGVGISADHLVHIFDMFWQADQDLTRRVGGSGVGLNVSQRLASLLGGHLSVESVEGVGSKFVVDIPLHPPGENTPP